MVRNKIVFTFNLLYLFFNKATPYFTDSARMNVVLDVSNIFNCIYNNLSVLRIFKLSMIQIHFYNI